jgi:phenylalanyl-tRNA synthetase beta chain
MLGLEVDAVQKLYEGLEDIVTAKVLSVAKHPNADRLSLCRVEVGDETVPIVCGAPNVRAGLITAIARPGCRLPDGHKIKKAKVRGELSMGMLCSWRELGLSEDHSGILELDSDLASGLSLVEVLELDDTMVEIDLTPNRADCASVIGVAREVAGFTGRKVVYPVAETPLLDGTGVDFTVTIDEPELCPRYAARKLINIAIKPSPWWLQRRLMAVGMRPINNIVDITNFVMLEYGQPLHAFDFKKIAGQAVTVRCPGEDETAFTTLDNTTRSLTPDMLMICDQEKPVAVAGVMGGLESEVTETTTEVLLESACFNPVSIRRTARVLNLPSEASYRFERGVDPDGIAQAMERAVQLICELAGAEALPGGVDLYPGRQDPLQLDLRVLRVNQLLGSDLTSDQVADYLRAIELEVMDKGENILQVTVPAFRIDIEREVDLVEEIARLVGYNEIPTSQPNIAMDYPRRAPLRTLRQDTGNILTALGFYEAINYSFVGRKHFDQLSLDQDDPRRQCVSLLNPLSEDQAVMRTMLLPGMLENVRHNINFQQTDIRLFETGKVFFPLGDGVQPDERYQLCAVISGGRYPGANTLYFAGEKADIFDLKGTAETLLRELRLQGTDGTISFEADTAAEPYAEPSSTLRIMDGKRRLGLISRLTRQAARGFSIKQDVYFMELDLEGLLDLPRKDKAFRSLPRFPAVKRDIALLVPADVPAGALLKNINDHKNEHVVHADIFDVYSGKPIEEGMKSVALTVTYRSDEKTLDDATVDGFHDKIVHSLMSNFAGRYREGKE